MGGVGEYAVAQQTAYKGNGAVGGIIGVEFALKESSEFVHEPEALNRRHIADHAGFIHGQIPEILHIYADGIPGDGFGVRFDCGAHDDRFGDADFFGKICLSIGRDDAGELFADYVGGLFPVFTGDDVEAFACCGAGLNAGFEDTDYAAKIFAAHGGEYRIGFSNGGGDLSFLREFKRLFTGYHTVLFGTAKDMDCIFAAFVDHVAQRVALFNEAVFDAAQVQQVADEAAGDLACAEYYAFHWFSSLPKSVNCSFSAG